ncbi:MAG: adenylyl-sulfate kinase [bacterium JZ-2024 1]
MKEGFVVWFTGLPASGKTTLAQMLRRSFSDLKVSAVILDGDQIRSNLWPELKYTREDRDENIRRMAHLAHLLIREGVVAIVSAISPYRRLRDYARHLARRFVEVYLDCPLEVCEKRDPKGMYLRARRGEIPQFTGISDPYEVPENPEIILKTAEFTPAQCLNILLERLRQLGYLGASSGGLITPNGGLLVNRVLDPNEVRQVLAENPPRLEVSDDVLMDAEKIAVGAYSPLTGFMDSRQIEEVLTTYRLPGGAPFGMPVFLCLQEQYARQLRPQDRVLLCQGTAEPIAVLNVEQVERVEPSAWARPMFGTEDTKHPGVAWLAALPEYLVSGEVSLIQGVKHPYQAYEESPSNLRKDFVARGWRKVAAFQTRNPPHRAHEYTQRLALQIADGLLIQPILGKKKEGDFGTEAILGAYERLIQNYLPQDRVILKGLSTWMRYAGPREAVFHAVVRRNYGCSHFIVGRDHAGVGSFYGPYDAQELLDRLEVGVEIIRVRTVYYCQRCDQFVSDDICGHPESERSTISMTRIKSLLKNDPGAADRILRPEVAQYLRELTAD